MSIRYKKICIKLLKLDRSNSSFAGKQTGFDCVAVKQSNTSSVLKIEHRTSGCFPL